MDENSALENWEKARLFPEELDICIIVRSKLCSFNASHKVSVKVLELSRWCIVQKTTRLGNDSNKSLMSLEIFRSQGD